MNLYSSSTTSKTRLLVIDFSASKCYILIYTLNLFHLKKIEFYYLERSSRSI